MSLASSRFRVFRGPEEAETALPPVMDKNRVSVPVSEILPMLADAYHANRTWLKDFADDEVTISTDLYEVILAYRFCRKPVA